ncbi:damage-control phosphatase ARMT1 family protein [Streptomyces sp. BE303]|uniref:damage-control phosphatase ARMT1 family protein n=1 Tax=Streptomyces sp. BE303 TaxID=3002528 RepID=UPI002E784B4A|nr:damage-control phosphatase ARMT1 family protein [Streptomyces sp. BE303]MED7949814.1 damage-control phosphatase ARMT1 family protein [Streptomyces sp. BE303]
MAEVAVIRSDVPGSFAWAVFHERHPRLVSQVLAALPYGARERAAVERLLVESTTGVLEPPPADAHDRAEWLAWGEGLWGRPWGEAPFLWAESYFYRRLLEATGYFGDGVWQGIDPFGPFKAPELADAAVDGFGDGPQELLVSSLWGNRADLGFRITAGEGRDAVRDALVVDDSAAFWAGLEKGRGGRVAVVADNAGPELLPDLALIDHLLTSGLAAGVALYVKPRPYFVSDATMADVLAAVGRLHGTAAGRRIRRAMEDGTLAVRTHPFFCAPLPYDAMPADLRAEFGGAALTVLKGDLNYRRLVGDRHWPPTTPFADTVDHFPSPVAALRTLKSDVLVGVDPGTLARLDRSGTAWRTDGRHALVQVRGAGQR